MTYGQTTLRIGSFLCSSAMSSGIIWLKTDTTFYIPLISSASPSSTGDCTMQLTETASFSGYQEFWWCLGWNQPTHRHEYDMS